MMMLSVTLSKKRKHRTTLPSASFHSASSESSYEDTDAMYDEEYPNKYISDRRHHRHARRVYFNSTGKLRQSFAFELAFQNAGGNVVCSPVSALLPLGKLVLGAEGKTRAELTDAIGLYKKSAVKRSFPALIKSLQFIPGGKLTVASRLYVSEDAEILPKFAETSKSIFRSSVEKVSFQEPKHAADEINGWVSRQTNGMIPLLMDPSMLSPNTSLVIVNAIYFKGKWRNPFDEVNVGDFYAPTGPKKVQLMTDHVNCRYMRSEILNAEIVEIPYEGQQGHEANFVIVLPLEKNGLTLLLNQLKLAPNLLNSALKKLKRHLIHLTIPKFSITTSFDLKTIYEKIGLKTMVSDASGLKNIVKNQELRISAAIQNAVIEVHERGTEASAASVVMIHSLGVGSTKLRAIRVSADHPFLFYVRAHQEQLLAGILSNPKTYFSPIID